MGGLGNKNSDNFLAISANLEGGELPKNLKLFLGGGSKMLKIIFDQFSRHFSQFGATLICFLFDSVLLVLLA